jgi:hypothetical protein
VCVLARQLIQLKNLQAARLRFHAQGVRLGPRFFRAAKHAHYLVATSQKRFQGGFAEILLTDKHDSHDFLPPSGASIPHRFA